MRIIGIHETDEFRDLVLTQRDRVTETDTPASPTATASPAAAPTSEPLLAVLEDIRDTLQRMESRLGRPGD